jgi:hypothetical protein
MPAEVGSNWKGAWAHMKAELPHPTFVTARTPTNQKTADSAASAYSAPSAEPELINKLPSFQVLQLNCFVIPFHSYSFGCADTLFAYSELIDHPTMSVSAQIKHNKKKKSTRL